MIVQEPIPGSTITGTVCLLAPQGRVIFPDLFIRLPLPQTRIDPRYFLIAWNAPATRDKLESAARTTAGIWKVNQGHLASVEIPTFSLPEQKRTVTKVDELMAFCDQLEAELATTRTARHALLESVLHEALAAGD